jgi:hypothetical protein
MADITASPGTLTATPRFSIGRTLSLSFAVLWSNLWPLSVIAIAVTTGQVALELSVPLTGYRSLVLLLAGLVAFALITAPVTYATLQHLRGRRLTLAGMLAGGMARLGRVLVGAIIVAFVLIVPIGALLALLPWIGSPELLMFGLTAAFFLTILVIWFVLMPVLVAEDVRLLSSFGRSRRLTSGRRWATLALALLLSATIFAVMTIAYILRFVVLGYALDLFIAYSVAPSMPAIPLSAFASLLTAIVPTVAYHLLRAEKEGVGADTHAGVFE